MGTKLSHTMVLLAVPAMLSAQDPPSAKPVSPVVIADNDPPLPPGAVKRLGRSGIHRPSHEVEFTADLLWKNSNRVSG